MDGLTMLGFILVAALSIGLTTEIRHVALVAVLVFGLLIAGLFTVSAAPVRRWTLGRLLPRLPGRLGAPQDLVGPILLLVSDAGRYIVGQTMLVDGGWTIC